MNADLIAGGLSPLSPESAAITAGRLFLKELNRFTARRADFAFESTLSGLVYVSRLKRWKKAEYRVEIIYLTLLDDFVEAGIILEGSINQLPMLG